MNELAVSCSQSQIPEQFGSLQGNSKILAAPGAGLLSQSVSRSRPLNTPCEPRTREDDLADHLKKDMYIEPSQDTKGNDNAETVAVPQPEIVDDNRSEITTVTDNGGADELNKNGQNNNDNMNNVNNKKPVETNNNRDSMETTENMKNDNDHINLVLQNEEGSTDVVDIDEADEVIATSPAAAKAGKEKPVLERRTSIQERLMRMKSSESLVESIKSECESRRKDFEDLIEEHAQIIEEISSIKESASMENDLNDLVNGGSQTS